MPRQLEQVLEVYDAICARKEAPLIREACLTDLFFLLVVGCQRQDLKQQWFLDRCDEMQEGPDGYLDLWAREHGKSSIITFGLNLLDALRNPEITIGIFSHTRPAAKGHLRPIKRELENNQLLKDLFPDALWQDPEREAPTWSLDDGLVLKRRGNPKEATFEAWGLIEGMPIGKHFDVLDFDDIVTPQNAASPEMREKTLDAWSQALNLGKRGGRVRMAGTRYHYADAYGVIIDRQAAKPRVYPALPIIGHSQDGQPLYGDDPVLLTREELDKKRRDMGPFVFASQMMLDPRKDSSVGFKLGWLRTYHGEADGNTYVIVDPANAKRKKSDYTAAWVVTAGRDRQWYVRWCTRDRLGLAERINLVMWMHREFQPVRVGYEQYGLQADIEAIEMEQARQRYRFDIVPLGGQLAKYERIQRLGPLLEQRMIWFPESIWVENRDRGETIDILQVFRDEEYTAWPYSAHDDMLDCLSRIQDPDLGVIWPRPSDSYRHRMSPRRRMVSAESRRFVA